MSEYSIQLRYVCESVSGLSESVCAVTDVNSVIATAITKLIDSDIMFKDADYTKALLKKIFTHYYFREIGAETPAMFRFYLNSKLREIMPYYNKLYKLQDEMIDKEFIDSTSTEHLVNNGSGHGDSSGNVTTVNDNTTNSVSKFSDTPQNMLSNVINNKYLTTANIDDVTAKGTNQSTSHSGNTYGSLNVIDTTKENRNRNMVDIYNDYKMLYNNIDLDIINQLEELFMQVW